MENQDFEKRKSPQCFRERIKKEKNNNSKICANFNNNYKRVILYFKKLGLNKDCKEYSKKYQECEV